jgi:hypothetical protein
VREVQEVIPILNRQRLVEPKTVSIGRDNHGVTGPLLSKVRSDRIRRSHMNEEECDEGDPD